ncbi:MAG: sigma-70 family RNA polymerase sigma factor [Cytophagales bacterium]|nr:sigma-70 family RNA polymerase sigma factor [Cytophagales bacterium]
MRNECLLSVGSNRYSNKLKAKDKNIITLIKQGEKRKSIQYLYTEYSDKVKSMIRNRGGNQEEAQDIFQDAILVFYQKVLENELKADSCNIGGFIMSVSQRMWYTKASRKEMMNRHHQNLRADEKVSTNYEFIFSEERQDLMKKILGMMGENCRKIIEYVIYDDLSMREIAQKMQYTSEDVVKATHYRCRQKLAKQLKENKSFIKSTLNLDE